MLQSEFTQRVEMEVSSTEFEAIHVVYMASELDKDEFCKVWKKMNAKRIAKIKAEKKALELRNKKISKLFAIRQSLLCSEIGNRNIRIDKAVSKKDVTYLCECGFTLFTFNYVNFESEYKYAFEVAYDIQEYIDNEVKIS